MTRLRKRKAKGKTPLTALAASDPFVQSIQKLAEIRPRPESPIAAR